MRGMKKSGSKAELVRLLTTVWPRGEDDQTTVRCNLCRVSVPVTVLVDHFKACKKVKEDTEKKKSEPFKIPKVVNSYDNEIRRKTAIAAFKSSDLVKKSLKGSKTFQPPFKEGIKLVIKGFGSRYKFLNYY